MMQVGASSRHGRPVGVIGSGQGTRVMLLRASPPALDLIAPDLSDASVEGVRPTDAAKPFFSSTHPPYAGPWPGSGDAPLAQVYGGTLIRATDDGHPALAAMAVLPGMVPVGELGPAGAWTALAQRTSLPASATDVAAAGGALLANNLLILTIARSRDVLSPETGGGELRPSVEGALVDARTANAAVPGLLTATPAFDALLPAPIDSVAVVVIGSSENSHLLVRNPDRSGSQIAGPPFRIPVDSFAGPGGNQAYNATLYVITPAGRGYTARWHVRLLRAPPKLDGQASFFSLSATATISGKTDPTATVTADGRSVHAGADGRYELNVPAGFVPRDVRVQARDPIGNVATITVTVAAPVDYRRLPWIPIMVVLTVSVGAILFLRAPKLASRPAARLAEEGTFDEIDADQPP